MEEEWFSDSFITRNIFKRNYIEAMQCQKKFFVMNFRKFLLIANSERRVKMSEFYVTLI